MKFWIALLAAPLLLAATHQASADPLNIGDSAPKLSVSKFVKGDKIERLEPGQTYVVEFWATWCGPCRTSIPHLTELQKKYKDKGVKFIGVSIWEQDQAKVEPFVKEMADKMDYIVAMDDLATEKDKDESNRGQMATHWMSAADENGIPTAFVINKDQKIAWIGHPMELDKPLEKIVANDWDLSAASVKRRDAKMLDARVAKVFTKIRPMLQAKDVKKALGAIDEALAEEPKLLTRLGMIKYNLLTQNGDAEAVTTFANQVVEKAVPDDSELLNTIAWNIVETRKKGEISKSDLELAIKAADRANEFTKGESFMVLDTVALVQFKAGNVAKAVELQEKAIKLAPEADDGMKERLEMFKKALKDK